MAKEGYGRLELRDSNAIAKVGEWLNPDKCV
jgi:hypothetical protein